MEDVEGSEQAERLRRKVNDVNAAAENQLSPIRHHIQFNLQKAYFKCAYECFDSRSSQDEINDCVEYCSVPVLQAQNAVETEMAELQDRLKRSLTACQDKFEVAKLQKIRTEAKNDLESCVDQSVNESIETLPYLVERLKDFLSIGD